MSSMYGKALQDFLNHVCAQRGEKTLMSDADAMSAEVVGIRGLIGSGA